MTDPVAPEADWDKAPGPLDGAKELTLGPSERDLTYALTSVAQGTLRDRGETGHHRNSVIPDFPKGPGPLREALIPEFGFRALSDKIGGYELGPGVRMPDTTPVQRYGMAEAHTAYMGLPVEALAGQRNQE
ncbi:hypothetical protein ACWCXB_34645 [Streptomyces sp. NPDC001514]